jgi:hypothetical protein
MGRRRIWIGILGGGAIAVATAMAIVGLCSGRLPEPATADRDGLLRWLVTRDLSQESAETRLALVRRLEQEFGGKTDWAAVGQRLDGPQKDCLCGNLTLLLEPWFADKVDGYFRLPENQRSAYVDRTVGLIENLRGAAALDAGRPAAPGHGKPPGLLEIFAQRIGAWMDSITPQRRDQAREFLLALQTRWLQGALLGPGPAKRL